MYTKGFSLIELLIALAILGILATVVTLPLNTFRVNAALSTETQDVVTLFNKARTQSIASYNDSQYGVHLETQKVVLFTGATYSPTASTNEVHILSPFITLSSIVVNGGGSDVVFKKVTGATDQNATTTLAGGGATRTIIMQPSGIIATY